MESQVKQRRMTRAVQQMGRLGRAIGLVGVSKAGKPYRVLPPVADARTAQLFSEATAQLAGLVADARAGSIREKGVLPVGKEQAAQGSAEAVEPGAA